MNILGIGPVEFIFVLIILILIFGPNDLAKAGKTIGRFLNRIVKSDGWRAVREVSKELKDLPNKLAREAELDDTLKELSGKSTAPPSQKSDSQGAKQTDSSPKNEEIEAGLKAWTTPPAKQPTSSDTSEPNIEHSD